MGILSRFSDIMSANINALLDGLEDPSKMVDQYLRKAAEDLAEVKKETANVIAEEKAAKRALDEANADVTKYMNMAKAAVASGNDDDARRLLGEKQAAEQRAQSALNTYSVAHANSEKMKQLHNKLAADVRDLEARRAGVKATNAVAKSQETVNKFSQTMGAGSKAADGFARMEQKAQARLDRAEAEAELNGAGVDDDIKALEKKYAGAGSVAVEDELAALKAELAGGTAE